MEANKVQLEIMGLSSSQSQTGSFALVLGEVDGSRRLPIIIGMFEAQAIAMELEGINPNRPMTHDLFKTFAENFDVDVLEVFISDLQEGVFFSKIICEQKGNIIEIDSRPSDAIAIGLRFDAEFYIDRSLIEQAGIVVTEKDQNNDDLSEANKKSKRIEDLSYSELKKMLSELIANEEYEKAARIRDLLNKRN